MVWVEDIMEVIEDSSLEIEGRRLEASEASDSGYLGLEWDLVAVVSWEDLMPWMADLVSLINIVLSHVDKNDLSKALDIEDGFSGKLDRKNREILD